VSKVIRSEGRGEDALVNGQVNGRLFLGMIKSGLGLVTNWTIMTTIGGISLKFGVGRGHYTPPNVKRHK
jgi:hypothetical protein